MTTQIDVMTKARAALVMTNPFFGTLALRMRIREDPTCQTAWCDGLTIAYNPDFVKKLTHDERIGLLAHEIGHPMLMHHTRRGNRNPRKWNMACDYALNPLLKGFTLPKGGLDNPAYHNMSADEIYTLLPDNPDSGGNSGGGSGSGGDTNDPGGCGEVRDAPQEAGQSQQASMQQAEAEWKQALAQARYVAQQAGKLPAHLDKLVDDALTPAVDWRAVLRRFCSDTARAEESWTHVNRRFVAMGMYLPSRHSETAGPIVIVRDTSGSIYCDPTALSQFMGEMSAITEDVRPSKVWVVDADADVHAVHELEPGEDLSVTAKVTGGGGTDFRPAFAWIEQQGIEPKCVVYLTDGYGTFPHEDDLPCPVLWAMTTDVIAPCGETVDIQTLS